MKFIVSLILFDPPYQNIGEYSKHQTRKGAWGTLSTIVEFHRGKYSRYDIYLFISK